MPVQRPTLPELIDQGATEFESRLPGVLARVRRSLVGVLNRVIAGGLSALYKYAEHLNQQAWPDQADEEHLAAHGARWGVPRGTAQPASGTARFIGTDGAAVPLGTVAQRADGAQYATTGAGIIAGGQALVPVQAVVANAVGNADVGTALTLTSPVPGVSSAATAYTALSGGADQQSLEAWRAAILRRVRRAPNGGDQQDYEDWAMEVPGTTRVWVTPNGLGAGTVVVRFMRDDDASPIPDAGKVAAMQAYIDARRPVTADVTVLAPIGVPQNFTIRLVPDTPENRGAVTAELADLIRREGVPGGTLLWSHMNEAISIAPGEVDHVLSAPAADVTYAIGRIPTMGVIAWV